MRNLNLLGNKQNQKTERGHKSQKVKQQEDKSSKERLPMTLEKRSLTARANKRQLILMMIMPLIQNHFKHLSSAKETETIVNIE